MNVDQGTLSLTAMTFSTPFIVTYAYICFSVRSTICLLYTSDAADERSRVDLGGRRIIKKKTKYTQS